MTRLMVVGHDLQLILNLRLLFTMPRKPGQFREQMDRVRCRVCLRWMVSAVRGCAVGLSDDGVLDGLGYELKHVVAVTKPGAW